MSVQTETASVTGVGASAPIQLKDTNDVRVAYAVSATGTVTFTVQHTLEGIIWFDNEDNTGRTASCDGNYSFPVQAVRVNITAGTGTATLIVRQLVV